MATINSRIESLRGYINGLTASDTVFVLADGSEFHTSMDPISYLYQHGAAAPDGRKIVACPHPVENVDALSLSLFRMIDDAIHAGGLDWSNLGSDDM